MAENQATIIPAQPDYELLAAGSCQTAKSMSRARRSSLGASNPPAKQPPSPLMSGTVEA